MTSDLTGPALIGLEGSIRRYRDARSAPGVARNDLLVPCIEGLWWARALDEHFDHGDYRQRRDADECGEVLQGVRYARNRAGHGFVSVLTAHAGATWPATWPKTWGDFTWVPLADLRDTERKPDPSGREAYERLLAGRPVPATLNNALTWLAAEAVR